MDCDHSLSPKDMLKFIYCLMILFLWYIFLNIFLLLVPWVPRAAGYGP
jgi:hypothetical protein